MKIHNDDLQAALDRGTLTALEIADLETWANVYGDEHRESIMWVDPVASTIGLALRDEHGHLVEAPEGGLPRDDDGEFIVRVVPLPTNLPARVSGLLARLAAEPKTETPE